MPPPAARIHPRPVGASNVVFTTDSYDQRWLMLTGQLPNTYHILPGGPSGKAKEACLEYEFAECATKVQKMLQPRDPVLDRVGDVSRPAA